MQKALRRRSSRRLSHEVVLSHRISGPRGRLPSFHDMFRNSTFKPASSDLSGKLPEVLLKDRAFYNPVKIFHNCLFQRYTFKNVYACRNMNLKL